jgi:predicted Zn-dependent protease
MEWAYKAGYSPCGSYRFANKLNYMSEGASLTSLSTHPGNNERMENALAFVQLKNIPSCSNDQDVNHSK